MQVLGFMAIHISSVFTSATRRGVPAEDISAGIDACTRAGLHHLEAFTDLEVDDILLIPNFSALNPLIKAALTALPMEARRRAQDPHGRCKRLKTEGGRGPHPHSFQALEIAIVCVVMCRRY